jgi:hypothetical protein
VWRFDDPEKAVAAQARLIEATGAALVKVGVLRDKPEIEPHARKHKGFDFTAVRMTWDAEKMLAAGGEVPGDKLAALKRLLGNGLNLWFGTDGKMFVQVTAADWDAAETQLDDYFKGDDRVGDDKAFAAARKGLPPEATVVMVIDVLRYTEQLGWLMQSPINAPAAKQGKPCYAGLAATLEPGRVSLDLSLPSEPGLRALGDAISWILWRR